MKNVALAAGVAVFALLGVLLAVVVVLAPTEQQATSDCTDGTLEAVSVTGSLPASVGVWKGERPRRHCRTPGGSPGLRTCATTPSSRPRPRPVVDAGSARAC